MEIFSFRHYRDYLRERLSARGMRSRLAAALDCQSAFVSQVLAGPTHFSLEHALRISQFLEHGKEEEGFFLLMVQADRSGTRELERHFREQMDAIVQARAAVKNRIGSADKLKPVEQMTYYGHWYYAAIHVLLSVPGMDTKTAIAKRLGLLPAVVGSALDFLVSAGLAEERHGKYRIGKARIHLGADSPLVARHHSNWRMQAMRAMDARDDGDLFYSAVYSLSENDAAKIRSLLLAALEKAEPIFRKSPEETIYGLGMDFFRL